MLAPPEVRLPPEVHRGAVIPVYVKLRVPIRTGLKKVAGRFVQVAPPQYVRTLEVRYRAEVVFRYDMTPALADNPLVSFKLRAVEAGPVAVTAVDHSGARVTTRVMLRFAG